MNIILGCEESQAVTIEFRKLGHKAFSCDLQPCSGDYPEWHIIDDIFKVVKGGRFKTQSGKYVTIKKWDMGVFFPPCTYLTVTANAWFKDQPPLKSGALVGQARRDARRDAIDFFIKLWNCDIPKIAIENPIGVMSSEFMKPHQIIQPFYFGDEARKTTCLWLKNLPPLYHNAIPNLFDENVTHVDQGEIFEWIDTKTGKKKSQPMWYALAKQGKDLGVRSKERSKTFPGIAFQMAAQWSNV